MWYGSCERTLTNNEEEERTRTTEWAALLYKPYEMTETLLVHSVGFYNRVVLGSPGNGKIFAQIIIVVDLVGSDHKKNRNAKQTPNSIDVQITFPVRPEVTITNNDNLLKHLA